MISRRALIAVSLVVAGCATRPELMWRRADGGLAIDGTNRYSSAYVICRGRIAAALAAAPNPPADSYRSVATSISRSGHTEAIMEGCMAEHGFVLR